MKKIIVFVLLLFSIYGESSIYVGDPIELRIGATMVEKELRDVFKDFYIEDIKDFEDYYNIKIRAKKPGDFILNIDNTQVTIKVLPTATSNEEFKEELTDGSNLLPKSPTFPYYILLAPVFIFLIIRSGMSFKKDKRIVIDPDREFRASMAKLSEENFLFDLSYALRRYLDRKSGSNTLYGEFDGEYMDIGDFLGKVEELKYSKKDYDRQEIKEEVMRIYNKLRGDVNA